MLNKVEICGVNTSKLPVIPHKKAKELFVLIKKGDKAAREEFIYGNLRLVLSVIQRFNNRGENIDDLFQVGCIGLIKSIDNFDLNQNVRFSTYAVPANIQSTKMYKNKKQSPKKALQKKTVATTVFSNGSYYYLGIIKVSPEARPISRKTPRPTIREIRNDLKYNLSGAPSFFSTLR